MVSIYKYCRAFIWSYRSKCKRFGRKRHQCGRGFKSLFKKVKGAAKKAAQSDIGKLAISNRLDHLPRLYTKGASKIKNKKIKPLLNSGAAHSLVNRGTKRLSSALLQLCKFYFVEKKLQEQINLFLINHKVHVWSIDLMLALTTV